MRRQLSYGKLLAVTLSPSSVFAQRLGATDPQTWVHQLYTYGPYAILALFVFWVAPRQTNAFLKITRSDSLKRLFSAALAILCWLVVGSMVVYILKSWPPQLVYRGYLGTHDTSAEFVPVSDDFFLATKGLSPNLERFRWEYAVVSTSLEPDRRGSFEFTYYWGDEPTDSDIYEIPLDLLRDRRIDLHRDDERVGGLLWDHDNDADTAMVAYKPMESGPGDDTASADGGWLSAYAQENDQVDTRALLNGLESSNRYVQARAKRHLRRLSDDELEELLRDPRLDEQAEMQIEKELERR